MTLNPRPTQYKAHDIAYFKATLIQAPQTQYNFFGQHKATD